MTIDRGHTPHGHLLFVDDDPGILTGWKLILQHLRQDWRLSFAHGAAEALKLMQEDPVDMMVADLHMPGMNGDRLLALVADLYPDTIRVLHSGDPDPERVRRDVPAAQEFLPKPGTREDIVNLLESYLVPVGSGAEEGQGDDRH